LENPTPLLGGEPGVSLSTGVVMRVALICAGIFFVMFLIHAGIGALGSAVDSRQQQYQHQVTRLMSSE
jgi:hypothetical protein